MVRRRRQSSTALGAVGTTASSQAYDHPSKSAAKVATISSTDEDLANPITAAINNAGTAGSKGSNFADFLLQANLYAGTAACARGQLSIIDAQHNVCSIDNARATPHISIAAGATIETRVGEGGSRNGLGYGNPVNCPGGTCRTTTPNPSVQQFDFQTPLPDVGQPAGAQCGRVVISDIHVARDRVDTGATGQAG